MKTKYSIYMLLLCLGMSQLLFSQTKTEQIKEKIKHPSSSTVLVASHRGDWRNYAENSVEAILGCIEMGVDIVEIDVAKTKDGQLILMHDRTIDRTTNGKGKVSEYTLDEIQKLYLKNGLGRVSEYKIPTLKEAMLVAKDNIIVNLDKADEYFDDVYEILKETGTISQTIIKSEKPYEQLVNQYGKKMDSMIFMPVINLNKINATDSIDAIIGRSFPLYELVVEKEDKPLLQHIKEQTDGKSSIWINSLWPSLCAGYSDDRAVKDPDANWGYLIRQGARVLQTDRPELMLHYLRKKGLHE